MLTVARPDGGTLQDVQRELETIKATRRQRQRQMYIMRPRPAHDASVTESSSAVDDAVCGSHRIYSTSPDATLLHHRCTPPNQGRSSRPTLPRNERSSAPYQPGTKVPPQLLRMAYIKGSSGSLCPRADHVMGSLVEILDLSPWDISAEQADTLWRDNR